MLPSKSGSSFKRSAARRASASLCCGDVARRMSSVAWRSRSSDCWTRGSPDFPPALDCPDEPDWPDEPDCPEELEEELPCCELDCEPDELWLLFRAICSIWRCNSSACPRS